VEAWLFGLSAEWYDLSEFEMKTCESLCMM